MADDIDRANDLAEMERNAAILEARRKSGPSYTGMCWNCSEPLSEGAFCDAECATDAQKREAFSR